MQDILSKMEEIFDGMDAEITVIPLNDPETKDDMFEKTQLPILPIRNTVLYPQMVIPIFINREKSMNLVRSVYKTDKIIGVVTQRDINNEDPRTDDLYNIGTVARILKISEVNDDTISVLVQGKKRFFIKEMLTEEPYFSAEVEFLSDDIPDETDSEFEAMTGALKDLCIKVVQLSPHIPSEAVMAIRNIESPIFLINFVSSNVDVELVEKQHFLEMDNIREKIGTLLRYLSRDVQKLQLKSDIQNKVHEELDRQQREYFLNQQIKTIQNELGGSPLDLEIEALEEKAAKKKWHKATFEVFKRELEKLKRIHTQSPEHSYQLNYVQTLVELPWNEFTKDNFDLHRAANILNEDHFGLEKVKERILEHLAVLKLKKSMKAPILCLFGPPGVGKTSLGKSIARALGRKYVRISLGGLHDEAEIRGHRKTYVGAMPGRIIQNLKRIQSSNPVFVLDEIDKIGHDFRGDASFALLEVLDPEQNANFYDNYLELEYDLSKILFIATANSTADIKPALRDRMEMINITGYVVEEKIEIAKRHLIEKQLEENGIKSANLEFSDETLAFIIDIYTKESGVRELERQIAKICRKMAKKIALKESYKPQISISDVTEMLGISKYEKEKYENNDFAGVVVGLAWTAVGGEILFVETSLSKGAGKLTLTGNLGDVMKESAVLALEYIKSNAKMFNIDEKMFKFLNVHIHIPEGAIPKDGPSAGITIATSLLSAFTQRKVRSNLAMTGEITLRGKVLGVGGIKEKILAAKRANITDIILSEENRKHITEINKLYLKGLTFHYVKTIQEVFDIALLNEKVSNPQIFDFSSKKETK